MRNERDPWAIEAMVKRSRVAVEMWGRREEEEEAGTRRDQGGAV